MTVPAGYRIDGVGVELTLCMDEQGPSLNTKSSTAISPVLPLPRSPSMII